MPTETSLSEAHLFLMPRLEDRHGIGVNTIPSHVAAIAEIDDPLAKIIGHVLDGTADARLLTDRLDAQADRPHAAAWRHRWSWVRGSDTSAEHRAVPVLTRSDVTCRGFEVVALFELG